MRRRPSAFGRAGDGPGCGRGAGRRRSARAGRSNRLARPIRATRTRSEVPVPLAPSDEELLRGKRFDALEPHELARLYRLMSELEVAPPLRRTRRARRDHHGERIDLRRTLRGSLRTGGDPVRLARRRRRIVRRRIVLLCDISGSMEPYARAYLQFLTCAAGSGRERGGVRVRDPADAPDARARLAQPRARDPARRGGRARLVERDADRRRAQGVQRPSRPSRNGSRRSDRDPLRRLGARRPDARRARDGAPGAPRSPDRVGQPARQRERLLAAHRRDGGGAAALRCARQRAQPRGARRGRRGDRCREWRTGRARRAARARARARLDLEPEDEPWASATPVPGSSVAMPSGYGPSRGRTTPGWGPLGR